MRISRFVTIALGLIVLSIAVYPRTASAQCDQPGITGGGSAFQYTGDEGPAVASPSPSVDSFMALRFNQVRLMAARWLAASRLAGGRALAPSLSRVRVRTR